MSPIHLLLYIYLASVLLAMIFSFFEAKKNLKSRGFFLGELGYCLIPVVNTAFLIGWIFGSIGESKWWKLWRVNVNNWLKTPL